MGDGAKDGMWHSGELLAEDPTCTGLVQELRGNTLQHSNLTFTPNIRTCRCVVSQGAEGPESGSPPSPLPPILTNAVCIGLKRGP